MQALLIAGNELRFLLEAVILRNYLLEKTQITKVKVIRSGYLSCHQLQARIENFLKTYDGQGLLLGYAGHADASGWEQGGWGHSMDYSVLSGLFASVTGPTTILNSCCYAGAISKYFDLNRVSVIAASEENRVTVADLFATAARCWVKSEEIPIREKTVDKEIIRIVDLSSIEEAEEGIIRFSAPIVESLPAETYREHIRFGLNLDHLFFPVK